MSPLPQRRKSPEEIAKLRDSFGMPGALDAGNAAKAAAAAESPHPTPATPSPLPEPAVERAPKPVRSLRKSERLAGNHGNRADPPLVSKLPQRRHSKDEIERIRRSEALSAMNATANRRLFPAHPLLITPGYLATAAAAGGILFYQIPLWATGACALFALAVAAFIILRHPVSRHHAAFIVVLAFLLLAFSALHYFPQLRHAT
jgi:hypothetical protein